MLSFISKKKIFLGLVIALVVAAFLSPFASSSPDGLERVAEDQGFAEQAIALNIPILAADYVFPGIANEAVATSIAGIIGTLGTFLFCFYLGKLLAKKNQEERENV